MIFGLEVSGDAAAQPLAVASWTYDRPDHPATTASIQRERGPHAVQPADHRMGVISATLRGAASGHGLAQSASAIYNDSVMSVLVDGHVLLSPKSKRPDAVRRAGFGTEMQRGGVAAETGVAPRVIRAGEFKLPGVPKGTVGVSVDTGKGLEYAIPRGTAEIDPRVTSVRIMDPVTTGKYQYPNGYAVYMNESGQTVNPLTGQTIGNSDPYAHIPLPR